MKLKMVCKLRLLSLCLFFVTNQASLSLLIASGERAASDLDSPSKYFKIQVVDEQTGRGVPLVELRTVNNIRYYTDSGGIVAFYEPGLMNQKVFFCVESHGYEFPKDGFGFRGRSLDVTSGGSAVLKIKRINIAERLYRITGQGIYRDSILTGQSVPLKYPLLNGQVAGQDSVYTCFYRGRLYWFWGDTGRPSYPLGHFGMAGAVSDLPGPGGLDPNIGINLTYFVDETGFSKPMCKFPEPGMVWAESFITVKDKQGDERMVAKYARMKSLGEVYGRGMMIFDDKTDSFQRLKTEGVDLFLYPDLGHPIRVQAEGYNWYYFAMPFPLTVRMRVRANWDDIMDPNAYEVFTCLERSGGRQKQTSSPDKSKVCRWIASSDLIGDPGAPGRRPDIVSTLKKERQSVHLIDVETGKAVSPHGGTVYWNGYRQKWVMITVQQFGEPSFLGEVWYAEADTPVGPFAYARKIVTHNKYSFYNPKQHPYFDEDNGRRIYFEGTYSFTFSGEASDATPRYDYNQIMYRLALDDPRLFLPSAVYQSRDEDGQIEYFLYDGLQKQSSLEMVESIPFFAMEPDRAYDGLIPIFAEKRKVKGKQVVVLRRQVQDKPISKPFFYAVAPNEESSVTVMLYEYHNKRSGERFYSTKPDVQKKGWTLSGEPICRVWPNPVEPLMLDSKAKPIVGYKWQ
jgi:hypothetical protein